jgi:hypothetical protein
MRQEAQLMRRKSKLGTRGSGRRFPGRRRTLLLRVLSVRNGSEEVKTMAIRGSSLQTRL